MTPREYIEFCDELELRCFRIGSDLADKHGQVSVQIDYEVMSDLIANTAHCVTLGRQLISLHPDFRAEDMPPRVCPSMVTG